MFTHTQKYSYNMFIIQSNIYYVSNYDSNYNVSMPLKQNCYIGKFITNCQITVTEHFSQNGFWFVGNYR